MTPQPPWVQVLTFTEDELATIATGVARVAEERREPHECPEGYPSARGLIRHETYQRCLASGQACPSCGWRAP